MLFHIEGKWENENQDEVNGAIREMGVKNVGRRTLDREENW